MMVGCRTPILAVTAVGVVAVALAYRPIRREPFTVLSFVAGWIAGELAFQNIVWQVIATVLFVTYGALDGWAGWLGLALAVVGWVGLVGLGIAGLRAVDVTAAALAEVRSAPFPVPAEPTAPDVGPLVARHAGHPAQVAGGRSHASTSTTGATGARTTASTSTAPGSRRRERAPVMVYVHGGAWVIGDKREQGKPMMFELVARGWVCVAINYRLSPKATWPDHIVDVKRALAWVKEHIAEYGGDPSFVAVSGGSAGGHLCALAALSAGDPAFQPGFEDEGHLGAGVRPVLRRHGPDAARPRRSLFGTGLVEMLEKTVMKEKESEHPDVFRDASPTFRVRADAPPFFVLQGVNDTLVPVETARTFVSRLRAVSRQPVAYAELPLAQHAFDVLASLRCQATTSAVGDFLEAARAAATAEACHPAAMDVTVHSK